jgi:alpha-ketoglutarate-dependent taurine dioxygenase
VATRCGPTCDFADETLAEPLRRLCDELVAFHYSADDAAAVQNGAGREWENAPVEAMVPVEHPVVRQHPETDRLALFVNPASRREARGSTVANRPTCCGCCTSTQHTRVHVPIPLGARVVGVLDNRATMHCGVHDYGTARRVMDRVTLRRDRPVGPSPARTTPSVPGQG